MPCQAGSGTIAAMTRTLLVMALAAACGACGGDPDDVAGDYTVSVTNRENGCMFDNWTEGESSSNIPVIITQEGANATVTVNGGAGVVLDLVLGGRAFDSSVSGSNIDGTILGTPSATEGNCTWTLNAILDAELDGDFLSGDIRYQAATNDNPDCVDIEGCVTRQQFNGNRPPR